MEKRPQEPFGQAIRHGLEPLAYWANNPPTVLGAALTTASAFTMIYSWLLWPNAGPYAGIALWLVLPAFFVGGLILIPAGMWRKRIRAYRGGLVPTKYPPLDLNLPLYRRPLAIVVALTCVNIAIFTTSTYRGVTYMDSVQFCGLTCHKVMAPEYAAYQNSPHSRVACVGCHIGPGASWFVRSKLSGTKQVFAATLNTYPKPIPAPVQNLRPARETCEECHWPAKFTANRLLVRDHFAEDEKNTATRNVLLLHVGGEDVLSGKSMGIHGMHMAQGTVIEYLPADRQRQSIPLVALRRKGGEPETFQQEDAKLTAEQQRAPRRVMDCMDCHNRPTHAFELPEEAVDRMLAAGRISPALPFAKKKGLELLKAVYGSQQEAGEKIRAAFRQYYRASYPQVAAERARDIDNGAQALVAIYSRNVFPQMNVTWGTYPNNIGHMNWPGCFRCHDGSHKSAKGNIINNDCGACHNLLAMDDAAPKILQDLGLASQPPASSR
jgi:nitrate/TMAO reductase-like tetraheme cytochrome c subunit